MPWRIRITGIRNLQGLPALAQLLLRLPGLDAERIKTGLRKPPLELPLIPDAAVAQKLQAALMKLGANLVSEEVDDPAQHPVVEESPKTAAPRLTTPQPRPQIHAGAADPIELRPPESRPSSAKRTHQERFRLDRRAIVLSGSLVAMVFFIWTLGQFRPDFLGGNRSASSVWGSLWGKPAPTDSTPNKDSSTPDSLKDLSVRQQAYANKQRSEATKSSDPKQAAALLETALRYDPWSEDVWKRLGQIARQLDDTDMKIRAEQGLQRASRARKSLEALLKPLYPEAQVHINVSRILITGIPASEGLAQQLQPFLAEAAHRHPEKEVVVRPNGAKDLVLR